MPLRSFARVTTARLTFLALLVASVLCRIDNYCGYEPQPDECQNLDAVYQEWGVHVESYCDGETADDVDFSYYVCDNNGHVVYLGVRSYSLEGSM